MRVPLLLLALVVAAFCTSSEARWVKQEPGKRLAIIFVHGVFGDEVKTWKNTGKDFPNLVADDTTTFANANVYSFAYPSPFVGKALSIDELADKLYWPRCNPAVLVFPDGTTPLKLRPSPLDAGASPTALGRRPLDAA